MGIHALVILTLTMFSAMSARRPAASRIVKDTQGELRQSFYFMLSFCLLMSVFV